MVVLFGERPDDAERLVEVAVDGHDPRAGDQRLEQLADRDLALRQDDDDLHPGGRTIGRRRGRGVPGRGADDRPGARLGRLGDRHDHPAILERPGRVLALDLEVEVAQPERGSEPLGADERREPFAEGQRRGRVGHRQEAPVALDEAWPARDRRRGVSVIDRVPDAAGAGQDRPVGPHDGIAGRGRRRTAVPTSSPRRARSRSDRRGPR